MPDTRVSLGAEAQPTEFLSNGLSPLRQLLGGTLWNGLAVAASRFLSSAMTIILAWWLEPSELGAISFVLAYYNVIALIADWSIGYGLQKLIPENQSIIAEIAWTALLVRLGFSSVLGILCVILDVTSGVFHGYGIYLALLLVSSAFGIIPYLRFACCDFMAGSLMAVALQLAWLAITVVLVRAGMRITGPLLGLCISYLCLGIVGFLLTPSLRRRISFLRHVALEILGFGLWATLATALNEFVGQIGILIATYASGDAAGGVFKVASTFGMVPALLGMTIALPLMPVAKRAMIERGHDSADLVLPIVRYLLMVGLPIAAAGIVLAPTVIRVFVRESYLSAVWPLRILLAANLLRMIVTALSGVLFVGEGLRQLAKIYSITAMVSVAGGILLGHFWGAPGVAMGILMAWAVGALLLQKLFIGETSLRLEWNKYLRYAGSAVFVAGLAFLTAGPAGHPLRQFLVGACVSGFAYAFLLWLQKDVAFLNLMGIFLRWPAR